MPAVLIAAFLVKSMELKTLRWLVVGVVLYAALSMLRSAWVEARVKVAPAPVPPVPDTAPPIL